MPIEIRELTIRAAVGGQRPQESGNTQSPEDIKKIKEELIQEVSDEVMRRIMMKYER